MESRRAWSIPYNGGMLAALLLALPSPQHPVDQEAINEAIDRGVVYLSELFDDGKKQKRINTSRTGLRALILYTLLKSGGDRDSVAVKTLFEQLSFAEFDGTYDIACMMLALEAHDPVRNRVWLEQLTEILVSWQNEGEWAYPQGAGDLSNTQYAALGLWAAEKAGVKVDHEVWSRLAEIVLDYQDEEGAFSYTRPGKSGYGSMTAAGVGTLALCEMHLARTGNLTADQAKRYTASRERGLEWFEKNFSVETNPGSGGWHYYYLYGLERMGGLAGAPLLGEHDWYVKGANYLVPRQDEEGSWTKGADLSETCFALLFLKRATSSDTPRAPLTGGGRVGDPPKNETADRTAAVQIIIDGSYPVEMSINTWGRAKTKSLEWPGESGKRPHVSRVEWLADGEIIAVRMGDARYPAKTARFTARYFFDKEGTVEIVCRVQIQPPNGGDPMYVESPPLEVEVTHPLPSWMPELDEDSGTSLMRGAKASARATSTFKKPTKLEPPLPDNKFPADNAVDGNARTPWLAIPKANEPKLTVKLGKVQEADLIVIYPAQLAPNHELAYPEKLIVRINKRETREVDVIPDAQRPLRIELAEPTRVKSLDISLVGRQGREELPMGIGEVEFRKLDG